jgi:hypothetical protein
VKKNGAGQWRDDFTGDWTSFVCGANAALSGRLSGWDLTDKDIAIVDTTAGNRRHLRAPADEHLHGARGQPASGEITLVGTDATNEVRFEPSCRAASVRVELARVTRSGRRRSPWST